MINYKKFAMKSIDYLYKYITDNHLKSLILGISGGIDSTVVACLTSIACKTAEIPLIGRSLPAHSNDPEELRAAILVGKAFCDDFKEIAIERMYAKVADEMELNEGKMNGLQLGNIKARLRMIYLYNLASIHRGCVLDTDNKSEHELGFWTIHGDVGDLNCGLIHLWKTEVYELANYLANEASGLTQEQRIALKESIKLIPTDGNGVMLGGDCAQFGLDNYEQVDDILKTMYYDENHAWDIPNEKGDKEYIRLIDSYNEQGVDKVMSLHQNSEFKRKPQPIFPTKTELGL
jgi:NAD+ synthetase